ncbi:13522_t:CDS:1 [Dentiscutata heterogama]|uniref:13522_t:CDS:1 n=1 Tax=Dentiscutata heterogama TaxID=1316150 RepID=A0ACA9LJQ4_9GLOM|nr:13522_t:CDS:1 [Dentiscutata heterogama]
MSKKNSTRRSPSSFILYKNENKFNPSVAKQNYENVAKEVRRAYERRAEMMRLNTTSIFINLGKKDFINASNFPNEQTTYVQRPLPIVTQNDQSELKLMNHGKTASHLIQVLMKFIQYFNSRYTGLVTQNDITEESISFTQSYESIDHITDGLASTAPKDETTPDFDQFTEKSMALVVSPSDNYFASYFDPFTEESVALVESPSDRYFAPFDDYFSPERHHIPIFGICNQNFLEFTDLNNSAYTTYIETQTEKTN